MELANIAIRHIWRLVPGGAEAVAGIVFSLTEAVRHALYMFLPFDLFSAIDAYRPALGLGIGAMAGWSVISLLAVMLTVFARTMSLALVVIVIASIVWLLCAVVAMYQGWPVYLPSFLNAG